MWLIYFVAFSHQSTSWSRGLCFPFPCGLSPLWLCLHDFGSAFPFRNDTGKGVPCVVRSCRRLIPPGNIAVPVSTLSHRRCIRSYIPGFFGLCWPVWLWTFL